MIALGWAADWASPLFAATSANHGADNRFGYFSGEGSTERFAWDGPTASLTAFAATPGGTGSRYLDMAAIEDALSKAGVPLRPSGDKPIRPVVDGQVVIIAVVGLELAALIAAAFVRRRRGDTWIARAVRRSSPVLVVLYLAIALGTRQVDLVPDAIEPVLTVVVPAAGALAIALVTIGWSPRRPATAHPTGHPRADPGDRR